MADGQFRVNRSIALLWTQAQSAWGSLMASAALVKIIEFSFFNYLQHYTNWSWTLQAVFYLLTAPGPILLATGARRPMRAVIFVIAVLLMPLWGVVVVVAVLVILMIATEAREIDEVFAQFPPGRVMLGNDIYHFVPVIGLLIYFALNKRTVFYALNLAMQGRDSEGRVYLSWPLFLYQAYGGTAITMLAYNTFFDPRRVYGSDVHVVWCVLAIILSLTISNAIPLLIAIYGWGLGTRRLSESYLFGPDRQLHKTVSV